MTLGQAGADKQSKRPETLRLGCPSPESSAAFKFKLEFTVELVMKGEVMLGSAQ